MKEYLRAFLEEYEYPYSTRTALLSVYDSVGENNVNKILQTYKSEAELDFDALTFLAEEFSRNANVSVYTTRLFALLCLT